jgi:hypothetical protein
MTINFNIHNRYGCIIALAVTIVFCRYNIYAGSPAEPMNMPVEKERMYNDVKLLTDIHPHRNARNVPSLNKSAEYILQELEKTGCRTEIQRFTSKGKEYKNVVCSFNPEEGERIIIGVHYDVCGDQPGAHDNTSGVAGLLELARLAHKVKPDLKYRTDFVAFALEEPQYFRTRHMGSHIYTESLKKADVQVRVMIALEMIGYFTEKPKS